MRLPWPHREGDADDAPLQAAVPSPESTGRLADRLHREVEDLRDELTDDLLLALLLLGEDEGEEAVGLLDLGSDRLHRFQDRVEGAVADAAVEREAEQVLTAAGADGHGTGTGSGARGTARRIRALATVAAAALAAIVALVSVEPSDPELVAARASSPPAATAPSGSGPPDVSAAGGARGSTDGAGTDESVSATAVTPDGRLEALRAIGDEGDVLAFLGKEPRRSAVAALFGVDRLVGELVAGAGETLPSETTGAVAETASELEVPLDASSPEPEPTTDGSPSEAPATDPAADGPTAEEPDDEATGETSSDGSDGTTDGASEDGDPDDTSSSDEPDDTSSTEEPSEDTDGRDGWFPSDTDGATATDGSGLL